jgi:hypothetical protein
MKIKQSRNHAGSTGMENRNPYKLRLLQKAQKKGNKPIPKYPKCIPRKP